MESNTSLEWLKLGATLLGGGAMGAFITAIVTSRRNRIQPIGKLVKIESLFAPGVVLKDHVTKITLSGATEEYHYDNLHLVQIELRNTGNKDYPEFNFGLTLPEFAQVITVKGDGEDRHHVLKTAQQIHFSTPSNILDISLKPFNRKDAYQITLYVTCENNADMFDLEFSTEMPVRFKDMQTLTASTLTGLQLIFSGFPLDISAELVKSVKKIS